MEKGSYDYQEVGGQAKKRLLWIGCVHIVLVQSRLSGFMCYRKGSNIGVTDAIRELKLLE